MIDCISRRLFYYYSSPPQRGRIETNLKASINHAFSITDLISDTRHQFGKKYHDYVLYADMIRNQKDEGGGAFGAQMFKKGLDQLLGTEVKKKGHGHGDDDVEMADHAGKATSSGEDHELPSAANAHEAGNGDASETITAPPTQEAPPSAVPASPAPTRSRMGETVTAGATPLLAPPGPAPASALPLALPKLALPSMGGAIPLLKKPGTGGAPLRPIGSAGVNVAAPAGEGASLLGGGAKSDS